MNLFDTIDYKSWVNSHIQSLPKGGRGQYKQMADYMSVNPTIVTQVFNGDRELTPEQGVLLADFFALSKLETRYFLLLVNYARAGTHLYKKKIFEEIGEVKEQAREIKNRVQQDQVLTEEAKAILYSNWYYLAIWSLSAIPDFQNIEAITERLKITKKKAREALEFLKKYGLVKEGENGQLKNGPTLVHLESTSSQIPRHHQNWRLQAFKRYENAQPTDAFYTAPITLSEKDAIIIRENFLKFVSQSIDIIKDSPSEKLYCLCMDLFEV